MVTEGCHGEGGGSSAAARVSTPKRVVGVSSGGTPVVADDELGMDVSACPASATLAASGASVRASSTARLASVKLRWSQSSTITSSAVWTIYAVPRQAPAQTRMLRTPVTPDFCLENPTMRNDVIGLLAVFGGINHLVVIASVRRPRARAHKKRPARVCETPART